MLLRTSPRQPPRQFLPLLGLILLAAAWAATMAWGEPHLAADLTARAAATNTAALGDDEPWLRTEVVGRDLVARGEAPAEPERAAALARLAALPGARRLLDRTGIVAERAPFVWTARRRAAERLDVAGDRPAELRRGALAAALAAVLPVGAALRDEARAARGAPANFAEGAAYALALVAHLAPGGVATLSDGVLALHGETPDLAADAALRAALAAPPAGLSLGEVAVVPPLVRPFAWSLVREADGGLAVEGYVASPADRRTVLAALAADGAPPRDRQHPGRGLDPAIAPRALAEAALAAARLLREGRVALEGTRLSVRGDAVDGQAVAEIEALLARLPTGLSPGEVAVTARPPSPYRTTLRRTADAVTLAGHLPDAAARDDVLATLRPLLFGERIVDRTRLAAGAPPDLGRALVAGAGALALLASGEVVAEERNLRLSGESLYAEAAERLRADLPRQVPAGWNAQVALTVPGRVAPLDPETCRARFGAAVAERPLRFPAAGSDLSPDFYPILDAVAALARACPGTRIAVAGHRDPPGARPAAPPAPEKAVAEKPVPDKPAPAAKPAAKGAAPAAKPTETSGATPDLGLPGRRAQAVADYLLKAGVAADRIAVLPEPARDAIGLELRS